MAKMIPQLDEEQLANVESSAEVTFYKACRDQLPSDTLVIYSIGFLYKTQKGHIVEGESDFTIASPRSGILSVEVKGGGISIDATSGKWFSTNRSNVRNTIKDPYRQAQKEKYAILDQLSGHTQWRQWSGKRLTAGHAVMFPDIEDCKDLLGMDRPIEITGVRRDVKNLNGWIEKVMRYWTQRDEDPLGSTGVHLLEEIICKSVDVRPVLRSALEDAENIRIRLTQRQAQILRIIGGRKRAVISGGAGTGKTLIAMEKARQIAQNGHEVLFLCYNRPLADALANANPDIKGLTILNFHRLCTQRVAMANALSSRNLLNEAMESYPSSSASDGFEVQWPFALALANELLPNKYDAIIVDEAQDFSDEYWFSIDEMLRSPEDGQLYIFIDQNQTLYPRHANLPVKDEPYNLTANCRNTSQIHDVGYLHYRGDPVDSPLLAGPEVEMHRIESDTEQIAAIAKIVRNLIVDEKIAPSDIVVLLAKIRKDYLFGLLNAQKITGSIGWTEHAGAGKSVIAHLAFNAWGRNSKADRLRLCTLGFVGDVGARLRVVICIEQKTVRHVDGAVCWG